jgi:hypothetical protein
MLDYSYKLDSIVVVVEGRVDELEVDDGDVFEISVQVN